MASRALLTAVLLLVAALGAAEADSICPVCVTALNGGATVCLGAEAKVGTITEKTGLTITACADFSVTAGVLQVATLSCGVCSRDSCPCMPPSCVDAVTNGPGTELKISCTCEPAPVTTPDGVEFLSARVCHDPHFTGAYGVHYDFHGLPGRDFNLITDQDLALNSHFIGQNGKETGFDGTYMSALGLLWKEGTNVRTAAITVKEGAAAFEDDVPFVIEIDGQPMTTSSFQAVDGGHEDGLFYKDESLTIGSSKLEYSRTITIKDHMTMTVTASTHEHPKGNHIDIGISKLNVTATVHGALGQTFAAARADALKAATALVGSGTPRFDEADIVEGKDVDYMTSSLLGTDFMYNRFKPNSGVLAKVNVFARKLLGAHDLDAAKFDLLKNDLSCKNLESGGIRCFN